jgi:hypothetical protein
MLTSTLSNPFTVGGFILLVNPHLLCCHTAFGVAILSNIIALEGRIETIFLLALQRMQ